MILCFRIVLIRTNFYQIKVITATKKYCQILIHHEKLSGKTNVLLNLIKYQHPDVDKIYLYAKNPCKTKYPLIINGTEKTGIKYEKNPKTFIDYLQRLMISMEI